LFHLLTATISEPTIIASSLSFLFPLRFFLLLDSSYSRSWMEVTIVNRKWPDEELEEDEHKDMPEVRKLNRRVWGLLFG
jgi:hypothetical protein